MLLTKAAILVAAVVYALGFGEGFLRVLAPQPLMPRFITGTDYGIRGNIPGVDYRQRTEEIDVTLHINAQGMRADREYPEAKPAGVCRVALLGDSYFMGYEADLEDTIGVRLEQRLALAGYNVEVLNFAVSGFGTAEMLVQFEHKVKQFAPDIVVFQFHGSDFNDNVRSNLFRLKDGRAVPTGADYLPAVGVRDWLGQFAVYRWMVENSHLYSAVRERAAEFVKKLLQRIRAVPEAHAAAPAPEFAAPGIPYAAAELTKAILIRAREEVTATGAAWRVLEIPTWSSRVDFVSRAGLFVSSPEIALRFTTPLRAMEARA
ncbi:MAG: SGNH/GDSL hydrolase family protein, partial [Alphaproteobacteria bacterium]